MRSRALTIFLGLVFVFACTPAEERSRPDVLLITIDTLRADYVHAYGFPLEITPSIDALAERGVLFENAIAAATLTAPAHASIMTSRYVREHSIGSRNGDTRLDELSTLAESFSEAGYATAAFVSNAVLRRRIGLDRGFDTYDDELPSREQNRGNYFERIAEETAG
ncbi:MAG: sulfatase-like hydrolase/transferase, partial [bacterium]|nr:sulfatase-like hydrolase/transferase [bacterium]